MSKDENVKLMQMFNTILKKHTKKTLIYESYRPYSTCV